MQVSSVHSRHFILYFVFVCCVLTLLACADLPSQQTETLWPPERSLQIDFIRFGWEDETVDVREVSRNFHDKTLYDRAIKALAMTRNFFLSSGTVNLLTTALNDDSEEVRQRAVSLLGYSRNPEAIDVITDSLQNDPSWRVRRAAAIVMGVLAGEAAVPALKAVLAERPTEHSSREHINYYGNYGHHVTDGALFGLWYAGGEGVPLLVKMQEDEIAEFGGKRDAISLIGCLEFTNDRRVISPLIDIISHPASPSDPNWDRVRKRAAMILDRPADDLRYRVGVQSRNLFLAKGSPVTPAKNRRVTPKDRIRIREALQIAGYEID